MKRTLFFAAAASLFLSTGSGNSAQGQTKGKAPAAPFTVQSATSRRTIYASGREELHTDTKISIVWHSKEVPQGIYYRPDPAHWLKCKATSSVKRPFGSGPGDFMVMEVNAKYQSFKPGDAINLIPEEFPSDVQPNAVKSMPAGALFYKMANSNTWQMVKVKMTKLPDLRRP